MIPGVTGGATFGGNQGQPVDISITVDPTTDTSSQILSEIDRQKEGLTLILTDVDREYTQIKDRNTAIISLIDSDGDKQTGNLNQQADEWIGVRQLSEAIPENTIETVVLDLNPAAFSWNTYYSDSDWRETATETGYPKALKQEAQKVLANTEGAKLIQVAPTATNTPGDSPFIRTHIALTVPTEAEKIGSPFITVDERAYTVDETDAEATDPDTLFYPTSRYTGEQKPSDLRHTNGTEGTYLRPAYQYVCPNCGAAQMNLCISDEGNPVPVGTVHNERAARENEFYNGELSLPLYEHVRGWIAQTDPARPQTAGGENETPTKQAVSDGGATPDDPSMSLAMF